MDNTNNKKYWNDYITYWKDKVKQANDDMDAEDRTSDDALLETYYKRLNVKEEDIFLDYGCGFGRLYPIYNKEFGKVNNYYGIDVSGVSLEYAEKNNEDLQIGRNLKEFDGLHIPFDDNFFDKIICFGVFDACNQEVVIRELFRVLKTEGVLLCTGKNDNYFRDDSAASVAEINARKKGHPNYFTDVHNFTKQLLEHNVNLLETYYFLKRGDFPKNHAVRKRPEIFYEYAYLMQKTEMYKNEAYQKFSNMYSKVII
ncbi:MAG: class I SAM-dependent methyltransferase [Lachnospiraceae bacterium]|nr:class I SAM-dependent methyltransferase [Lachnospiraceae bacterium]